MAVEQVNAALEDKPEPAHMRAHYCVNNVWRTGGDEAVQHDLEAHWGGHLRATVFDKLKRALCVLLQVVLCIYIHTHTL